MILMAALIVGLAVGDDEHDFASVLVEHACVSCAETDLTLVGVDLSALDHPGFRHTCFGTLDSELLACRPCKRFVFSSRFTI